ncbi:MAG TPA: hypothetical protein VEV62_02635 [Parafilimonas sp.]|nr:hypothetical protein [Parafilimonas sp.]
MCLLKKCTLLSIICVFCFSYNSNAQFLKKLKDKVNNAVNGNNSNSSDQTTQNSSNANSSGSPTNTKGGGLTNTTPPDVNQQIADAEKSQASGNYSDARYSIQQALMGIELQIGKEVLQSLPATVSGLQKDTTQSKVMSTQWGWNNLTIQSVYKKADQQLTVTIGNNTVYSGFVDLYFNNAGYMQTQSNGNNQNVKQTKVKNYRALITYDESKGYTLLVQLGQSSLIVWECVNFATEQDVMNAADAFDVDGIKKMLGEQ